MFLRAATAVLALSVPAMSAAEGRSDGLMDLLSRAPAAAIDPQIGAPSNMWFADFAAAARTLDPMPSWAEGSKAERLGPFSRASAYDLGDFLMTGLEGSWEPLIGFSPLDMEAQLTWGQAFERSLLLRLAPEAAGRVGSTLLAAGYSEETRDGLSAFVNAVPDGDLADFDAFPREWREHPFQGPLGYPSRVALDGSLLLHANTWTDLLVVTGHGAPQGHPDLPALAAALDSPDWGDLELLQASFLPHQFDLGGPGSGGLPAWDLGVLVDLGSGTESVGLALFTYRHEAEARQAAQRIAKAWDGARPGSPDDLVELMLREPGAELPDNLDDLPARPSMAELIGLPVETGVTGDGPYVAWAALRATPEVRDGWIRNPGFHKLYAAMLDRQLGLFGLP